MKFEIKNNKIYRKGEEIKPDTSGTNGKVVSGMSHTAYGFQLQQVPKKLQYTKRTSLTLPQTPTKFL